MNVNVAIPGDFDVPSSREDVDRDSMWNQWLQSEIHALFVEALKTFKVSTHIRATFSGRIVLILIIVPIS